MSRGRFLTGSSILIPKLVGNRTRAVIRLVWPSFLARDVDDDFRRPHDLSNRDLPLSQAFRHHVGPTLQPAPQHLAEEMAHGRTGGWLLAAGTISAAQTTRPPEIIIEITSEEIRPYQPKHSPSFTREVMSVCHLQVDYIWSLGDSTVTSIHYGIDLTLYLKAKM